MNLVSLPPEVIEIFLSWMTLSSAVSFSQTCRRVRTVSGNAVIGWMHVLEQAATLANVHMRTTRVSHLALVDSMVALDELAAAGASSCIPARAWVLLLPQLARQCVLNQLEVPRLTGQEWEEVIFLIAHRKSGLTRNRQALREFNPRATFEDLRRQNSLTDMSVVVAFTVPAPLVPVDMAVTFLVSIGQSTFLTNKHCSKVLESFGFPFCGGGGENGAATNVLGPVMIFAEARSATADAVAGAGAALAPLSLDLADLFQVCGQKGYTREWWESRCEVKDGMGF
ncbi:hypothetical protein ACM66B_005074 [Microbotryomycetes sp. NB124-2]